MNAPDFESMNPAMKEEFAKMYEPVEFTGKQLKERLRDDDRMVVFEQRRDNLKAQTKK